MLENGADVIEGKTKDENNNDVKEQNRDYNRKKLLWSYKISIYSNKALLTYYFRYKLIFEQQLTNYSIIGII